MFEPMAELEPVQVGLAFADSIESHRSGAILPVQLSATPLAQLSATSIAASGLDLLLVGGASSQQIETITEACDSCGCIVAFIDGHGGDKQVAWNAMVNIKAKLEAHEMPANLGVTDVRELASLADALLAFDSEQSLLEFLHATATERHCGVIYLASGSVGLARYSEMNQAIAAVLSPSAYFVSSVYSANSHDCIALVGIRQP
ncbi:hypothetical protein [Ferrimonas sp. SCSIO 43195]|uniref:hypothetical protein n=1 Tax=Ferrimonas sp. SCSIO 43195 TaxID=2822844 RepID=UPI0020754C5F|nr:hypothetical protein [Ferrimonas sp. SCSIO 43195]USD39497.1 hypothetical protein J8Z22_10630 [Ferrimonas sp. SCSIO 43195]